MLRIRASIRLRIIKNAKIITVARIQILNSISVSPIGIRTHMGESPMRCFMTTRSVKRKGIRIII